MNAGAMKRLNRLPSIEGVRTTPIYSSSKALTLPQIFNTGPAMDDMVMVKQEGRWVKRGELEE